MNNGTERKSALTIRFANSADNDSLTNFRIAQFKSAREFELVDFTLLAEQRGAIYIVELNGEIISTMQYELFNHPSKLCDSTHVHIADSFQDFNTLYLSKAGTLKEHRNMGLNSYLRLLILQTAIDSSSINSLTGVAYENAPRLQLLKRIGYEFINATLVDLKYIIPNGKVFLLNLRKEKFAKAHMILTNEIKEMSETFKIIVEKPSSC